MKPIAEAIARLIDRLGPEEVILLALIATLVALPLLVLLAKP